MALPAAPQRILDNGDLMACWEPIVSGMDVDGVVGNSEQFPIPLMVPSGTLPVATTSVGNDKAELLLSTNSQPEPKPKRVSLEPFACTRVTDYPMLIADHGMIVDDDQDDDEEDDYEEDEDFDADSLLKMQLIEDDEDLDMFFFVEDDIMDIPVALVADEDLDQVVNVSSFDQDGGRYDPQCLECCPWNSCTIHPVRVGYHETPVGATAKV
jgi:hypothetical protein